MAKSIKLRAKESGGVVTVKVLINHPMETGLRKDKKTGKMIPAHFIQEVTAKIGDRTVAATHTLEQLGTVLEAAWGGAISTNPYLSFKCSGAKGDSLTLSWADNKGESDSITESVD